MFILSRDRSRDMLTTGGFLQFYTSRHHLYILQSGILTIYAIASFPLWRVTQCVKKAYNSEVIPQFGSTKYLTLFTRLHSIITHCQTFFVLCMGCANSLNNRLCRIGMAPRIKMYFENLIFILHFLLLKFNSSQN